MKNKTKIEIDPKNNTKTEKKNLQDQFEKFLEN